VIAEQTYILLYGKYACMSKNKFLSVLILYCIGDLITSIIGFMIYGYDIESNNIAKYFILNFGITSLVLIKIFTMVYLYFICKMMDKLKFANTSNYILDSFIIIGMVIILNNTSGIIYQWTIFNDVFRYEYFMILIITLLSLLGIIMDYKNNSIQNRSIKTKRQTEPANT
jgi:hypothetical protein